MTAAQLPGAVVDEAVAVYAEVRHQLARADLTEREQAHLLAASEALLPVLLVEGIDPSVFDPEVW